MTFFDRCTRTVATFFGSLVGVITLWGLVAGVILLLIL